MEIIKSAKPYTRKYPGATRERAGGGYDHVKELRELLGADVLLLRCGPGSKKPLDRWKGLTASAMERPEYLARLGQGNIGVVLGKRSGGLCSLDIDSQEGMEVFEGLNSGICRTLCTCGARGCNFWWRLQGPYPPLTPLKLNGDPWGEWRSDGAQTLIWGTHPSGKVYRMINRVQPIEIRFDQIKWPEAVQPPLGNLSEGGVTERTENTQRTERTQSTQATEDYRGGKGFAGCEGAVPSSEAAGVCSGSRVTIEQALALARPSKSGANHDLLFKLARGIKGAELTLGKSLTQEELQEVFEQWYAGAAGCLKAESGRDDYWMELMEAYERVKHPLGVSVFDVAWQKAQKANPPAAALKLFHDRDTQLAVSLCRELWLANKCEPFFLSCRKLQQLFGHREHVRAARWLKAFCNPKVGILAVVEVGTATTRRATRYRYVPKD